MFFGRCCIWVVSKTKGYFSKKNKKKPTAIKPERGWGKALMARTLRENFFCGFPEQIDIIFFFLFRKNSFPAFEGLVSIFCTIQMLSPRLRV